MSADDAAEFLSLWPGRHCLVAIDPDTRGTRAKVFHPGDDPRDWIARAVADRLNCYWTVNEVRADSPDRKPAKADIALIRALHVDLDPEPGVEIQAARAAIQRRVLDAAARGTGIAAPVAVAACVDSGGGFQLFIPISESLPADAAERLNAALARELGAPKGTHNVDRLMRLPGTMNWPTATKRATGRVPAPARLLRAPTGTVSVSSLLHLVPVAAPEPTAVEDRDAIQAAAAEIARTPYESGEIDAGTQAALDADHTLRAAWSGQHTQQDQSASGYRMALASRAKALGLSAPQFAVLAATGEKTQQRDGENEQQYVRQLARAWANAKPPEPPKPEEFFAPIAPEQPSIFDAAPPAPQARLPVAWIIGGALDPDLEIPDQRWIVDQFIPVGEVTSLYGAGGEGKTLVAHQLALCLAAGIPWLGARTARHLRVHAVFCEDHERDLLRRHRTLMKRLGLSPADLGDRFRFSARRGFDNALCRFASDGTMSYTPFCDQLYADFADDKADLLIFDTITDGFTGNEVDRGQVNTFVKRGTGRFTSETTSALMLGHPSVAGQQSGSGLSGSTHWENAVRSRLYLQRPEKSQPNTTWRVLRNMKLNAGRRGGEIQMEWVAGLFEPRTSTLPQAADQPQILTTQEAARERIFRALAAAENQHMAEGRNSNSSTCQVLRRASTDPLDGISDDTILAELAQAIRENRVEEIHARDAAKIRRRYLKIRL